MAVFSLITGASSGIGAEFATQLAAEGRDLVLVARRLQRLEDLATHLRSVFGITVYVHAADLSQNGAANDLHDWIRKQGLIVDLLVNNAGFGLVGSCSNLSLEQEEAMLRLNISTLHTLTRLFLTDFLVQGHAAGIINVASTAAFQPIPFMAVYAATKAFVLHFTEALATELTGSNVAVMALCPGLTKTEFQQVAGMPSQPAKIEMTPQEVVRLGLQAFHRGQIVAIPGHFNKTLATTVKWIPRKTLRTAAARMIRKNLLDPRGDAR